MSLEDEIMFIYNEVKEKGLQEKVHQVLKDQGLQVVQKGQKGYLSALPPTKCATQPTNQ